MWESKIYDFFKGIKLDFICMKMKVTKNKKYLQQKFSRKVLVLHATADFMSRVSKSYMYVPFTCKFLMVTHLVLIRHKRCKSKTNFYVFSFDKTIFKFYVIFRFSLALFMEKFRKTCYLNYGRRGKVEKFNIVTYSFL